MSPMTLSERILARAAGVPQVKPGDFLGIEPDPGLALTLPSGLALAITPFPPFMERIVKEGGWIPYLAAVHGGQEGAS